jgi:hypothetical protein
MKVNFLLFEFSEVKLLVGEFCHHSQFENMSSKDRSHIIVISSYLYWYYDHIKEISEYVNLLFIQINT